MINIIFEKVQLYLINNYQYYSSILLAFFVWLQSFNYAECSDFYDKQVKKIEILAKASLIFCQKDMRIPDANTHIQYVFSC
ncbi:MAG: hypothetical protein ACI8QG_001892 [Flavobacteriales bacterium]|jgi:hypothetical protein